ncbi:MAG: outer membrane lipoprotein-sorting protein [Candidatus Aminicenantes bacterium]|nr:outer membrane lipoprotein-sorting protein [Candidatus Aminicenantes bacterium]
MMKTILHIALPAVLIVTSLAGGETAAASAEPADTRLAQIDSFRIPDGEYRVRTKISQWVGDTLAETALFDVYVSGPDKSLVIARRYKTEGMRLLFVGENMWVLFRDTQRPIRITPVQRLLGEASNGDVARLGLNADYEVAEESREDVGGVPCLKLLLAAVRKSSTYGRILLFVRASDLRPVKADLFLISGKHAKSAVYDEYRSTGGRTTLARMTIFDRIEPAKRTVFEYLDITPVALPDKYFNKNYLVHLQDPDK